MEEGSIFSSRLLCRDVRSHVYIYMYVLYLSSINIILTQLQVDSRVIAPLHDVRLGVVRHRLAQPKTHPGQEGLRTQSTPGAQEVPETAVGCSSASPLRFFATGLSTSKGVPWSDGWLSWTGVCGGFPRKNGLGFRLLLESRRNRHGKTFSR